MIRHTSPRYCGRWPCLPAMALAWVCIPSTACVAAAQDAPTPSSGASSTARLTATSSEVARSLAKAICEQMDPRKPSSLPFEADPTRAVALQSEDKSIEIVVVPAGGLRDDPDDPFLNQDRGVAVGYLRMRGLIPAEAALARDSFFTPAEDDSTALVAVLSIQKLSGSEFRLQLWGQSDAPLAAVPLFAVRPDGAEPARIRSFPGLIEFTWAGKYRAYLPIDVPPEP